jgi:small subunit ribosomal protein S18
MPKVFQKKRRKYTPAVKKAPKDLQFDYKDARALGRYLMENGAIGGRDKTGLSLKQQRQLVREIKRARHLAMLPFTQTL